MAIAPRVAVVPEGYAQRAMATLMQLHNELMEEKERRVDLYRQLMDKEQAIAELKMYVRLLEEKVEAKPPARLRPVRSASPRRPPPPPPPPAAAPPVRPKLQAVRPAAPRNEAAKASGDDWRSW
jgi:hypothetical protein